jgi:bifunctional DNase/RNase
VEPGEPDAAPTGPLDGAEATGADPEPAPAPTTWAELAAATTPAQRPAPAPAAAPGPHAATSEVVELALASVHLAPPEVQPATGTVSLLDLAGGGQLDIVMARADAVLVQEAIAGAAPPRPRTHDLLLAAVEALGGAVVAVTLVDRRAGGVYVANLRVRRSDGSTVELDARPSDALNVALRSTGAVLQAARFLLDVPAN